MESLNQQIETHYFKAGLFEDIISRLKEQGNDINSVSRANIAGVDEFHVRGAAVSREIARSIDMTGRKVLDVGCGLGGPCRMLADEFGCITTGIDLSEEYIRTARKLSELVGLDHKTTFVQGDATALPFEDGAFDVVWTQHVQMNIPNKKTFYAEINRVLKTGGHFIYYDIFRKGDEQVTYPMPWASHADCSFLFETEEMDEILGELEFTRKQSTDQTRAGIDFFEALILKLADFGPPKIGLNVLMGKSTRPKLTNLLAHLKKGTLMLQSGVYVK